MVFAHQGGWDEMLFVAIPIGLFALLLYVANRKAQSQVEGKGPDGPERAGDVRSDDD